MTDTTKQIDLDKRTSQDKEDYQDTVHYDVYEVFVQRDILAHHVHVGSVVAPSPELALQVARESFLRREQAVNIWVALQNNIHATSYTDADALVNQSLDKSYREVAGYSENAQKWKRFKEKSITIDDLVNDVKTK